MRAVHSEQGLLQDVCKSKICLANTVTTTASDPLNLKIGKDPLVADRQGPKPPCRRSPQHDVPLLHKVSMIGIMEPPIFAVMEPVERVEKGSSDPPSNQGHGESWSCKHSPPPTCESAPHRHDSKTDGWGCRHAPAFARMPPPEPRRREGAFPGQASPTAGQWPEPAHILSAPSALSRLWTGRSLPSSSYG